MMNFDQNIVIAIDGASASGKGTLAKMLAAHYNTKYLPTGNLYRVIAKQVIESDVNIEDPASVKHLIERITYADLFAGNLNTSEIAAVASKIAALEYVRTALYEFQRNWAKNTKIAILEGRDIGTVICPDADVKLFLSADIEARAKRRWKDFSDNGSNITYQTVYNDLNERDNRDSNRKLSPLLKARDAIEIDSTSISAEQVLAESIRIIEKEIDKNRQNL